MLVVTRTPTLSRSFCSDAAPDDQTDVLGEPLAKSAQFVERARAVVDIDDAGGFTTLVAAVQAAGRAETLSGPGPFTVFAPTDAAFAKLPEGTVAGLLKNKEQLASILTFHVLSGTVMAADVIQTNGAKPNTVNGMPLDIVVRGGKVYVNGAQVVTADIVASNGVIHVIDSVLLPGSVSAGAGR